MVATIVAAADKLRIPRAAPDGSERVSGHSLRATGSHGLARVGLDLWAIQLLGRWGSDVVRPYVQEAHLSRSTEWARRALLSPSLDQVVAKAAPAVARAKARGAKLVDAVTQTCRDVATSTDAPATPADEVADQLVAPVLESLRDVEFAPPSVERVAASAGTDQQLAQEEQQSAVIAFNSARGVAHRVLYASLEGNADLDTAACGWRFGKASGVTFPDASSIKGDYRSLCGRCFPRWRALRKRLGASPGEAPSTESVGGGAARASA